MSMWILILAIGAVIALAGSLIAGLKDNLFAAQMALAVGLVFDMFLIGLLIYIILSNLGAFIQ